MSTILNLVSFDDKVDVVASVWGRNNIDTTNFTMIVDGTLTVEER